MVEAAFQPPALVRRFPQLQTISSPRFALSWLAGAHHSFEQPWLYAASLE
jgi:hypothetical protein